jgi:hypothetical protein
MFYNLLYLMFIYCKVYKKLRFGYAKIALSSSLNFHPLWSSPRIYPSGPIFSDASAYRSQSAQMLRS